MKKTILLPIEVANRELPSKLLLAHKFASNDCIVYLGTKGSILDLSRYVPRAVYFDKGYHKNVSEKIYDDLESSEIDIVSLDEENAVDFSDFQQLNSRFPDYILKRFCLIFIWGEKQFSFLKNNRANLDLSKTLVTGHPRFELLKEEYHSLYKEDSERYKKIYGSFSLVNTNFGLGNNVKGDEFAIANYGSRFPNIKDLITYQKVQVLNFVELCKNLSSVRKSRIIVRPHPEENPDTYKNYFKDYPNIDVISKGSVIPWILAADVMIHHDCTTAIESAMLGKNSIAYTKDLNLDLVTDIPLKISYRYSDERDIIKHMKSYNQMPLKTNTVILNDYFNFYSSGIDKILEETLKLAGPTKIRKNALFFYQLTSNLKINLAGIFGKFDKLFHRKIDGLEINNIRQFLERYSELYSCSVSVKRINDRLYMIKANDL